MALSPRISLEQWRALQAVVDAGGYAQAAGAELFVELYLIYADRDYAGPGAQRLAGILRDQVKAACQGS